MSIDKSQIPKTTHKIKDGDSEVVIELYEWITIQEENEIRSVIYELYEADEKKNKIIRDENIKKNHEIMARSSELIMKAMLASVSYKEFQQLKPSIREKIDKLVAKQYKKSKKK